jgi:hypothetical protein
MEFDNPTKGPDNLIFVNVHVLNDFIYEYVISDSSISTTTPSIDSYIFKNYVDSLAEKYEAYSTKWFSNPVKAFVFLNRVSHIWNFANHASYSGNDKNVTVRQTWCPEQIKILQNSYKIHWLLKSVEYIQQPLSGHDDTEIPFTTSNEIIQIESTLRAREKKALRKYRIKAALVKWKLLELTAAYYEKYANNEAADRGSVLSSELNSDAE